MYPIERAISEFLDDLRLAGRAARTVEGHAAELRRLAAWLSGQELDWQQLDRRQLQGWTRLRAGRGHSSRANMLCTLRGFFGWAVEQGYCVASPATEFKTPKRPRPLPRALSQEQARMLVGRLRGVSTCRELRDAALIFTGLYAGLRSKELANLRWTAIDYDSKRINIWLSKMGHGRAIHLHDDLARVLQRWQGVQGADSNSICFSLDGREIKPNRVGKVVKSYAVELGIPMTTHTLRHTFATLAYRASGDIYSVSAALGHSELRQTEVYVHADTASSRGAVTSLPPLDAL